MDKSQVKCLKSLGLTSHLLEDSRLVRRRFLIFDKRTGVPGDGGKAPGCQRKAGKLPRPSRFVSPVSNNHGHARQICFKCSNEGTSVENSGGTPPTKQIQSQLSPRAGAGPPQLHVSPGGMSRLARVHLEGPILQSFTQAHGLHTSNELLAS